METTAGRTARRTGRRRPLLGLAEAWLPEKSLFPDKAWFPEKGWFQVRVWFPMARIRRDRFEQYFLPLARAVTVGAAYVSASPIPGLTSSFVAIFVALLPFDMIVASERPPIRWQHWRDLFALLRPRLLSTASTLLKGVAVGAAFGILAVLGLPHTLGAVLTSGLAYVWALGTRHVITTYVAILSGLVLFERLAALDAVETVRIVLEIVGVIASAGGGTFLALLAGWAVGLVSGSIVRLFLSRPYRSLRSSAYDPPIIMRPFNEVLHVGEKSLVVATTVEEGAPVAHKSLAESRLKERWKTTVLSVKRGGGELVMPEGSLVLLPGDEVMLLTERDAAPLMHGQFKAAGGGGGVEAPPV